eukprot:353939-Chlamydomonas_euryale.AAC.23
MRAPRRIKGSKHGRGESGKGGKSGQAQSEAPFIIASSPHPSSPPPLPTQLDPHTSAWLVCRRHALTIPA